MCACNCRRRSVIIFCADLDSSCVRLKEVRPCTIVAPRTARTIGVNSCICLCSTTLSTKYFMEPSSTNPATRLMAIRTNPRASSPRLGFINAQRSGRFFHAFLRFSLLPVDLGAVSLAMIGGKKYTPAIRCRGCSHVYIAKTNRKEQRSSIARCARPRHAGPGGPIETQNAGDEFADGDSEVPPESPLQAGVILRAAEEIAHQLPEHRTAPHELHHPRGHRAPQKRSSIETPHDACRELQLRAESSLHPGRVLLRTAFGKRTAEQFARTNGIEKTLARERIDPRRRISHERPVLSNHGSFRKPALLRRWQHMAIKLCALRLDGVLIHECLQMPAQFRARMRRHTPANPHRKVIASRERPDITLKVSQEFDGDGVSGLRDKITLGHLQLIALQGS